MSWKENFRNGTRVLIAEECPFFTKGLERILSQGRGFELIGSVPSTEEGIRKGLAGRPDVMILGVGSNHVDLMERVKGVLAKMPGVVLVLITGPGDAPWESRLLRLGVRAILRRDCTDKDLLGAIDEARAGRLFLDARVSSGVLGYLMSPRAGVDSTMRRLSDRELQVLELLADGVTPGGIGLRLQLAPRTVSAHLAKMQRKLEVGSTQALIVYAVRWRCGKEEVAKRGPGSVGLGRDRRVA